jgi:hypothetical protein
MKKILVSLLVLAMCAPAMAAVTASWLDNEDGTGTLTLTAGTGEDIVGIGLLVDATAGQVDSYNVDSFFDIFVDVAFDQETNGDGYTYGEGVSTVSAADPAGPGLLADLPSADPFSISVGGLGGEVEPLAAAPAVAQIVLNAAGGATIDLAIDPIRGGIVGSAGTHTVTGLPPTVTITDVPPECIDSGHADYAEWSAVGKPDSWCAPRQCYGDADGLSHKYADAPPFPPGLPDLYSYVTSEDVTILVTGYKAAYSGDPATDPWIAADFDRANRKYADAPPFPPGLPDLYARVTAEDVAILVTYYKAADAAIPTDCND